MLLLISQNLTRIKKKPEKKGGTKKEMFTLHLKKKTKQHSEKPTQTYIIHVTSAKVQSAKLTRKNKK